MMTVLYIPYRKSLFLDFCVVHDREEAGNTSFPGHPQRATFSHGGTADRIELSFSLIIPNIHRSIREKRSVTQRAAV